MKWFNVFLAVKTALSAVTLFGAEPPKPRLPASVLASLQKRVADLEQRVSRLEGTKATCPCPNGPCICNPNSCDCEDCPKHKSKPATENAFTGNGREVVVLGTSWCPQCPAAKQAAMANGATYLDAEKDAKGIELNKKYHVNSYPRIMVFQNGVLKTHITRADWPSAIRREANEFEPTPIKKTSPQYNYSKSGYNPTVKCTVSRLNPQRWPWPGNLGQHLQSEHGFNPAGYSHQELVTVHDNFHNTGRSGVSGRQRSVSSPVRYYQPARQYKPRVYFRQSYCPSCVR